jgi:hypothetical protein
VLDGNEDGEKEIQCGECGSRYRIKIEDNEIIEFEMLNQGGTYKEA